MAPMSKVLVVDDELKIARLVRDYLTEAGFVVSLASTGPAAVAAARSERPDLVVLDLGLPGMDGYDVTRAIRAQSAIPIIMLTARNEETDRIVGLELGADDYVVKPFSPRELVARVKAVLRRVGGEVATETIRVRDLEISIPHRSVTRAGDPSSSPPRSSSCCGYSPPARVGCSPGASCSTHSAGCLSSPTSGRSTPMSRTCARSWSPIPDTRPTCSPCTASATNSPMPDPEHWGPPWSREGGGPPGWGPGRHIFARLIVFGVFLLLAITFFGFFVSRFARFGWGHPWLIGGFVILGLVGLAVGARLIFGRSWAPVGELIDATSRLGDGETGVRINQVRPGPFGAVGASFNRMAARLEEEDERRRRLLADLGHELRTPLTVIRGEIEAVLDGIHDPQSLSSVVDEVDLMERLLEDLRVLTLTEAGRLQLHKESTDVETLITEVVTSFGMAIASRQVKATMTIADSAGEIEADPYRLRQVLANLVSNALNQMPDGGELRITAYGEAGWVTVEVADTGPGIPPDRLEQVFQRFVKAGDSTGTGLGLSIARDLVEAHGGTLQAGNRDGGGALFTIRLPVG